MPRGHRRLRHVPLPWHWNNPPPSSPSPQYIGREVWKAFFARNAEGGLSPSWYRGRVFNVTHGEGREETLFGVMYEDGDEEVRPDGRGFGFASVVPLRPKPLPLPRSPA
mmetsp:Transcript_69751/g.220854  ORF Transcript_69751/g.220854 Transcript_69751/m.220854 type:complete len:109 (+) Transcript_69751:191-517(+)